MQIISVALGSGLSPEAWNAIIVSIVGSFGAFAVSRYTAKRQADREDTDDGRAFRGELRDDNAALRTELRDVKDERDSFRDRCSALERELRNLYAGRLVRQTSDAESEARLRELDKGSLENKSADTGKRIS